MSTKFREIEHKFILNETADHQPLLQRIRALRPEKEIAVDVVDTYFLVNTLASHIFRHRYDRELQQLTVKSLESDNESRFEVNLDLLHPGNQLEKVDVMFRSLGLHWSGSLTKELIAFHFPQCEIAFYRAYTTDQSVVCLEFEAIGCASESEALSVIKAYEARLGFKSEERSNKTLFDLLLLRSFEDSTRKAER